MRRLAIGTMWALISLGSPLFILASIGWAFAVGRPAWPVAIVLGAAAVLAVVMLIVALWTIGMLVEGPE